MFRTSLLIRPRLSLLWIELQVLYCTSLFFSLENKDTNGFHRLKTQGVGVSAVSFLPGRHNGSDDSVPPGWRQVQSSTYKFSKCKYI